MKFETRTRVGGSLTKGHLLKKEATYGGYDSHQGFFGIHWEVQEKYPKRVFLQVESPKQEVSRTLNRIKENMIKDLLNSEIESVGKENGLEIAPGERLSYIKSNKSTGVFSIDFVEEKDPKTLIRNVNDILGKQVEEIIGKYRKEIKLILS